jgi:hypothetical protein
VLQTLDSLQPAVIANGNEDEPAEMMSATTNTSEPIDSSELEQPSAWTDTQAANEGGVEAIETAPVAPVELAEAAHVAPAVPVVEATHVATIAVAAEEPAAAPELRYEPAAESSEPAVAAAPTTPVDAGVTAQVAAFFAEEPVAALPPELEVHAERTSSIRVDLLREASDPLSGLERVAPRARAVARKWNKVAVAKRFAQSRVVSQLEHAQSLLTSTIRERSQWLGKRVAGLFNRA